MADKDRPSEAPQLEMPSMGSLFKRKKKSSPPPAEEPAAARSRQDDDAAAPVPMSSQPEASESLPAAPSAIAESAAPSAIAEPAPAAEPARLATRTVEEESSLDDIDDDAPDLAPEPAPEPTPVLQPNDDGWRFWRLPELDGRIAAAITGLVIGLLAVGLTAAGLSGCEAVRGTSSCGGSGLGVLLLIMVALVALGSLLLTAWQVPDPTSTSFLAVGLLAVVSLLFLIEVILSMAMIVVIPLITVATFSLSHWVTTHFTDDE